MTMATMEEMGVQNNDEGPHEQKKPHSANYTAMEDVIITMAYFKASEDLICGAKQKGHTFRSKIELAYNTIKKQQAEKEAQDLLQSSHLRAMDICVIHNYNFNKIKWNSVHMLKWLCMNDGRCCMTKLVAHKHLQQGIISHLV